MEKLLLFRITEERYFNIRANSAEEAMGLYKQCPLKYGHLQDGSKIIGAVNIEEFLSKVENSKESEE